MDELSNLLTPECIILDLKAQDKVGVIRELGQRLIDQGVVADPEGFFQVILRRENLESTGIGNGVAIPHARSRSVKRLILAYGRSRNGVNFNSLDNQPCFDIFLIAAPEDKKSEYIVTLARLSKLLRQEAVRRQLSSASSPEEVIEIVRRL